MIHTDEKFLDKSQGNNQGSRPLSAKIVDKRAGVTPRRKQLRPKSAKRNIIYAPSKKPDTSYVSRLRPANIQIEKERLYDDNLSLRIQINALKRENISIKTKMKQLEKEFKKKNEEFEDIGNNEKSPSFKYMRLTNSLKQNIKDLRAECKNREDEISKLKKNMRVSKVAELEIEILTYKEESVRLRQTCEELIKRKAPETTLSIYPEENRNKDVIIANLKREKQDLSNFISNLQDENYKLKEKFEDYDKNKKKISRKEVSNSIKLENQKLRIQIEENLREKQEKEQEQSSEVNKYKKILEELNRKLSAEEKVCRDWKEKAEIYEKTLQQNFEKKEKNLIEKSITINVEAGKAKKDTKVQLIKSSEVSFYFKHILLAMQLHRYEYTQLTEILLSKFSSKDPLLDASSVLNLFQNPPFTFKTKVNMHPLGQFLVQPHEGQIEESDLKLLKIPASQAVEKIKKNLQEWQIFDTQEEAQFDFDLGQLIQNHKKDLKSLCKKHDSEGQGVIEIKDFKAILTQIKAVISPRLFEYMTLLFYSNDYEIEKVPYKNFIKAYGKPQASTPEIEIDEEKINAMKNCLNQIAQILIKRKLTVKEVFKYDQLFIYPESFIAGLEYLGLKNIDQEVVILILDQLQCEKETENCILAEEFEKIMEGFGVNNMKKNGRPSTKSFSSKGSSGESGNLRRISMLESENYEYSEDSPDKFGISEISPFGSVSNVENYHKMSPMGNDNSKTELERVQDESSGAESEEKMEKIQLSPNLKVQQDEGQLRKEDFSLNKEELKGESEDYEENFEESLSEDIKKIEAESDSSSSSEKNIKLGNKKSKSRSDSSSSSEEKGKFRNKNNKSGNDSSSSSEKSEVHSKKKSKFSSVSSSSSEKNKVLMRKKSKSSISSSLSSKKHSIKSEIKHESKSSSSEKQIKVQSVVKDSKSSSKVFDDKKDESMKEYSESFSSDKPEKVKESISSKSSIEVQEKVKLYKDREDDVYSSDKSQEKNKDINNYSAEESLNESIKSSESKSSEKQFLIETKNKKSSENLIKHSDSSHSSPKIPKKTSSQSKSSSSVSKELNISKINDAHSIKPITIPAEPPLDLPSKSQNSSKISEKSSNKNKDSNKSLSSSEKFKGDSSKSSSKSLSLHIKPKIIPEFPETVYKEPEFPKLSSHRSSSSSSEKSESKSSEKKSFKVQEYKEPFVPIEKNSFEQIQNQDFKEEFNAGESLKSDKKDFDDYSEEFKDEEISGSVDQKLIEEYSESKSKNSGANEEFKPISEKEDSKHSETDEKLEEIKDIQNKSKSSKNSEKSKNFSESKPLDQGYEFKDNSESVSIKPDEYVINKSESSSSKSKEHVKNKSESSSSKSKELKKVKKESSSSSKKEYAQVKSKSSSIKGDEKSKNKSKSSSSSSSSSLFEGDEKSNNKSKSSASSISLKSDKQGIHEFRPLLNTESKQNIEKLPLEDLKDYSNSFTDRVEEEKVEENLETLIKDKSAAKDQIEVLSQPENVSDTKKSSRKGSVSESIGKGSRKYSNTDSISEKIKEIGEGITEKIKHDLDSKHSSKQNKSERSYEKSESGISQKFSKKSSLKSKLSESNFNDFKKSLDDEEKLKSVEKFSIKSEKSIKEVKIPSESEKSSKASKKSLKSKSSSKKSENSSIKTIKSSKSKKSSKKSLKEDKKSSIKSEVYSSDSEKSSKKSKDSSKKSKKSSSSSDSHKNKSKKSESSIHEIDNQADSTHKRFSIASMMLGKKLATESIPLSKSVPMVNENRVIQEIPSEQIYHEEGLPPKNLEYKPSIDSQIAENKIDSQSESYSGEKFEDDKHINPDQNEENEDLYF